MTQSLSAFSNLTQSLKNLPLVDRMGKTIASNAKSLKLEVEKDPGSCLAALILATLSIAGLRWGFDSALSRVPIYCVRKYALPTVMRGFDATQLWVFFKALDASTTFRIYSDSGNDNDFLRPYGKSGS